MMMLRYKVDLLGRTKLHLGDEPSILIADTFTFVYEDIVTVVIAAIAFPRYAVAIASLDITLLSGAFIYRIYGEDFA